MKKNYKKAVVSLAAISLFLLFLFKGADILFTPEQKEGRFYLVSAGVGDPDLITVRAVDTIKQSDIIICTPQMREHLKDYLSGKTFLEGAFNEWRTYGKDCTLIDDNEEREKCKDDRRVIEKLEADIRNTVNGGKTVSVLGSGDLTIYPGALRWYMEEMDDLIHEIVPGVSSFNTANANLRRDLTGDSGSNSAALTDYADIDRVAPGNPTLVIFTMGAVFGDIVDKLKIYYPGDTPVAIVFYAGYREKEYRISGSLNNIMEKTEGVNFPFEHLIYVGNFLK